MFSDVYFFKKGRPFCCFASFDRAFGGASEWDAVFGKGSSEKHDPESSPGVGCTFPMGPRAETASRNARSERDALSGSAFKRKLHPRFQLQNGTHFPDGASGENCVPEFGPRTGYVFRQGPQVEATSQNPQWHRSAIYVRTGGYAYRNVAIRGKDGCHVDGQSWLCERWCRGRGRGHARSRCV